MRSSETAMPDGAVVYRLRERDSRGARGGGVHAGEAKSLQARHLYCTETTPVSNTLRDKYGYTALHFTVDARTAHMCPR